MKTYWTSEAINGAYLAPCETKESYSKDLNRKWVDQYPLRCWTVDLPVNSIPDGCANVNGEVVLDLGCGFVGASVSTNYVSTPERFLELGATKVIGVDLTANDITILEQKLPKDKFVGVCDKVDTHEKYRRLIQQHNPTIVKSDIEGDEIMLLSLPNEEFSNIKEYYMECHNRELFSSFLKKFDECGYDIREVICYNPEFGWPDFPEIVRIIYAYKKI